MRLPHLSRHFAPAVSSLDLVVHGELTMKDGSLRVPKAVSYFDLLVELQRRLDAGWTPDDVLYFTELSIELIESYRISNYRVVSFLENSLALPAYEPDCARAA